LTFSTPGVVEVTNGMNNLAACLQAFCAGGDVKEVVTHAMAGRFEYPDKFFTTEYSVNER
jgi:hypothetical protein